MGIAGRSPDEGFPRKLGVYLVYFPIVISTTSRAGTAIAALVPSFRRDWSHAPGPLIPM
jgi:hypothetical protein